MSTNKSFWRMWLSGKEEHAHKEDPLEEGLKDLTCTEKEKKMGARFRRRAQTIGEEIGNTLTHGVMALFVLGILPLASVRAYLRAPQGQEILDPLAVSIFLISIFLMLLASTIYHSMSRATPHKAVMNRIDHIMIYFAIAGTYTPICLSVIGGGWGLGLCIAQWTLVIAGTLFKSLAFSKSVRSYIFTISIYLLMGWMVVLCLPILWAAANTVMFWLIVSGGFFYTAGIVCFALKFKFSHMVWHFFVDLGAVSHLIAIVFFMHA